LAVPAPGMSSLELLVLAAWEGPIGDAGDVIKGGQ
jgi:hypothetical protein